MPKPKQKYLAKEDEYEDYVARPPAVRVWKNTTKSIKFLDRAHWEGKQHFRNRVLPGEFHVIDDQRGERAMDTEELALLYTKKPGRKPADKSEKA